MPCLDVLGGYYVHCCIVTVCAVLQAQVTAFATTYARALYALATGITDPAAAVARVPASLTVRSIFCDLLDSRCPQRGDTVLHA